MTPSYSSRRSSSNPFRSVPNPFHVYRSVEVLDTEALIDLRNDFVQEHKMRSEKAFFGNTGTLNSQRDPSEPKRVEIISHNHVIRHNYEMVQQQGLRHPLGWMILTQLQEPEDEQTLRLAPSNRYLRMTNKKLVFGLGFDESDVLSGCFRRVKSALDAGVTTSVSTTKPRIILGEITYGYPLDHKKEAAVKKIAEEIFEERKQEYLRRELTLSPVTVAGAIFDPYIDETGRFASI